MSEQPTQPQGEPIDLTKASENAQAVLEGAKIKETHDDAVQSRENNKYWAGRVDEEVDALSSAQDKLKGSDALTTKEADVVKRAITDRSRVAEMDKKSSLEGADERESDRKVAVYDATEHLHNNEETLKADAIVEANKAGHDITYNGVHYPADGSASEPAKSGQPPVAQNQ